MKIGSPHTMAQTVKALRNHLGLTQQQFANRLGLALSSVVRYERGNEPEPAVLAKLLDIAEQAGRGDLATTFRDPIVEYFGSFAIHVARDLRETLARAESALTGIPNHRDIPGVSAAIEALAHAANLARGIDPFYRC